MDLYLGNDDTEAEADKRLLSKKTHSTFSHSFFSNWCFTLLPIISISIFAEFVDIFRHPDNYIETTVYYLNYQTNFCNIDYIDYIYGDSHYLLAQLNQNDTALYSI